MEFRPPALLKATVAAIFFGMGVYFQKNRFLRKRVMIEHSRINLLELPDEIILQIFEHVHDTPTPTSSRNGQEEWTRYESYDEGTRDIQNIRLTCREFNRIGSELLIKFVGVDVSAESLGRLQEIMRHPIIVKGVRMVRIRLTVYDWILYISQDQHKTEMVGRLQSYRRAMDRAVNNLAARYDGGQRIHFPPLEQVYAANWRAHGEYRRRYMAQASFPKLQFIEDVAQALKMSKRPLRIEFTDCNDLRWSRLQATCRASKENQLAEFLRPQASTWEELHARYPHMSRNFGYMIPLLLSSFGHNEIRIGELHFDITRTARSVHVTRKQPICSAIEKALQEVRKFSFQSHNGSWDFGDGPEWKTVLYDRLPPKSLRELELWHVELDPSPHWRSLTLIVLVGVVLDFKRLKLLLEPLERHSVEIHLADCFLTDGSWADVLDLLRERQCRARLYRPRGIVLSDKVSDWVASDDVVSPETMNYLFVHLPDWYGGASKAEQYIVRLWDANPIRQNVRMN